MGEIKFRAVIPERNATIYFDLTDLVHPARKDLFSKRELLIPWLVAGNIPDLFIGLKDKSGREIYGGDKVRADNRIYEVLFCNGSFKFMEMKSMFEGVIDFFPACILQGCHCDENVEMFEVIGNIHENAEAGKTL